jgi:DNA-binding MarR family transcriptional regulator
MATSTKTTEDFDASLASPPSAFSRMPTQHRASVLVWVQLLRSYTKAQQKMSHVLSRHGLTSPQFDVLATLHRGEGLMQQELATRLLVTKGNICGVLDRLEAAGRIERRPDPEDRRTNCIYLTEKGRQVFAETLPDHHAHIYEMMAGFDAEQIKTLQSLLQTLESRADE